MDRWIDRYDGWIDIWIEWMDNRYSGLMIGVMDG